MTARLEDEGFAAADRRTRQGEGFAAADRRTRRSLGGLALAAVLVAGAVAVAVVAVRGPAPAGSIQEQVRTIGEGLRCPVCQNLSVADSPSRTAQEMRERIAAGLRAGRTPDQIRADFVAAYGEWILLSPPKRGINLAAWIVPALLLAGGLALALMAVRRWTSDESDERLGPAGPLSGEDRLVLERALAREDEEPE